MDSPAALALLDRLTARQRECLELVAQHWTSKEIGRRLQIAPKTVDRHIEEAVHRFGVNDRAAAVRLLLQAGLAREPKTFAVQRTGDGGDDPHGERSPVLEAALSSDGLDRGGGNTYGQTVADVHLDRRTGRPGDPRRNLAAEESGVLVAGAAETGLGGFTARRTPGGDHQYGASPWGVAPPRGWAPEPVRRLGWVLIIAAGLALVAGALIGSYDLMSAIHRIYHHPVAQVSAGSPDLQRPQARRLRG